MGTPLLSLASYLLADNTAKSIVQVRTWGLGTLEISSYTAAASRVKNRQHTKMSTLWSPRRLAVVVETETRKKAVIDAKKNTLRSSPWQRQHGDLNYKIRPVSCQDQV